MKICKFCNCENSDKTTVCSHCGANEFKYKCGNCGTVYEEGVFCPHCGVKIGQKPKLCPKCNKEYYSNVCPDCGYGTKDTPRQTVVYNVQNSSNKTPQKKRKTWLWVLGWIFIFPVPLTIILLKKQNMKKSIKIPIIVVAWILYFLFAAIGSYSEENVATNTDGSQETAVTTTINTENSEYTTEQVVISEKDSEKTTNITESTECTIEPISVTENSSITPGIDLSSDKMKNAYSRIQEFVEQYSTNSKTELEFIEDFIPKDKSNEHYRTEFRLTAYIEAVGCSYKLGDTTIDIIASQQALGGMLIRIYAVGATIEQCCQLIQYASPLLDPEISDDDVNNAVNYIAENKTANGYYYDNNKLTLLLLGSEFMLSYG